MCFAAAAGSGLPMLVEAISSAWSRSAWILLISAPCAIASLRSSGVRAVLANSTNPSADSFITRAASSRLSAKSFWLSEARARFWKRSPSNWRELESRRISTAVVSAAPSFAVPAALSSWR